MHTRTQRSKKPADVYFFGSCLFGVLLPEAGIDAITRLESEGINVHCPGTQSCCDQPALV